MVTLREHLDQQIREIDYWLNGDQTTFGNLGLLRILREHAVAALAILDGAGVVSTPWFSLLEGPHRLVPDPDAAS